MRRILIVDDISINREILKGILGGEYEIIEAGDGEEALAIMRKTHLSLSAVLLDVMMPVMDGYGVLESMRKSEELSQLPVIVVTSNNDEKMMVRALALGANDYISKPYNPDIIRHCLRNNITLRENAATINAMTRDKLTGLLSREAFFVKAAELIAECAPGSLILACIDINNFKLINGQYGATEGDRILRHIGFSLSDFFENVSGVCGRISSDNFVVLYPNTEKAIELATRCRKEALVLKDSPAKITFSVGRYVINDPALPVSEMYDRAYLAKKSVKGMYNKHIAYFDESMLSQLLREQRIIEDMDEAIAGRQFEVWYQPQMNHSSGALIGAEALVRWRHPVRGLIMPGEFITLFEQNGFVYELDKYVWEDVCVRLRRLIDEGENPPPVSVNISRYDLFRDDVVDVIIGLVRKYNIPTGLLRLEITESAFVDSDEQVIRIVKRLMDCGFTTEIDDFGCGYSSLNTLKDVPADILKLDMRFLENDGDSQRGGNILESIVRMARRLGMSVLAEGVEEREQADFLKSIGCSYVQGYLYAAPMPAEEYERFARTVAKEEKMLTIETVENLDNNAFWNPRSMDTLIFNSYVGGACIFEYHNGNLEMLRATDKFAKVLLGEAATVEEALSIDWQSCLSSESYIRLITTIRKAAETHEEATAEYVFDGIPGKTREIHLRSTIRIIAAAGERYTVYCTSENITAQRDAEEKERHLSEQLRAIMTNINGGVTATVINGDNAELLYANDRYFEQLGYTEDQFAAEVKSAFDLVHPSDRERVRVQTNTASRECRSYSIDYRIIRRDGRVRWMLSNISMAKFPGVDEPVQLAVANDITEQRVSERKEREIAAQMQAIMDNVGSGVTAMISEGDSCKLLFANDKYYEIHDLDRKASDSEEFDLFSIIYSEDMESVRAVSRQSIASGENAETEYRVLRRDGATVWVHAILTNARFPGISSQVQLAIFNDITAAKFAEEQLRNTDELLRFLNITAHSLLAQPDAEKAIEEVLEGLLTYFNGRRAYVFEIDRRGGVVHNTYEVCAQGVRSEKADLQNVPLDTISLWLPALEQDNYVSIFNVDALDDTRPEKKLLQAQGIKMLVAVPLMRDGKLLGFIGVDDPDGSRLSIGRIVALGDYIAVMLTRRDLQEKILIDDAVMKTLMDDTPVGFCRVRLSPDKDSGRLVYFNDGFCRLVGMTRDETEKKLGSNPFDGIHPKDRQRLFSALREVAPVGGRFNIRCRIRHTEDEYICVMLNGRVANDENGDAYLNSYQTDITEQVREEKRQKELLDNLPCGAAIYEYDGKTLTAVHLNKWYRELVKRGTSGSLPETALDRVYPDDREKIAKELREAVEQKRDALCDVRLLYGKNEYRPFRLAGSMVEKGDGKYSLYVSLTPISESEAVLSDRLPEVLASIMKSFTNYSFVKDANYRYMCCSKGVVEMLGKESDRDIIGKTDYELFPREMADKYREDDKRLMTEGEPLINMVEELPHLNGIPHYSRTSKFPLKDASGRFIGLYGVGNDVTENRDAYAKLRLLTDSIPGGLSTYVYTDDGVRLTYFNDGFCSLFGYSREEYERLVGDDPSASVFAEDMHKVGEQTERLLRDNIPMNCRYRIHTKDGGYKWIQHRAAATYRNNGTTIVNAVMFDVTEEHEATELLRVQETEYRLATEHSGNMIGKYVTADKILTVSPEAARLLTIPESDSDVPKSHVRLGKVSPACVDAYVEFFERICSGSESGEAVFLFRTSKGWRWIKARFSTIFSDSGEPVSAVISFNDVSEQREKESVYIKWQQSLSDRDSDAFSLFRCNLGKGASYVRMEGSLLRMKFDDPERTFDERTAEYAVQYVYEPDRERYSAFLAIDRLLENYFNGKHTDMLEYREKQEDGGYRWLSVSVDLTEYPGTTDVEIFLMYENIDKRKRAELQAAKLVETDALTGVLNRFTFTERMEALLGQLKSGDSCALLMLDMDGFKRINDVFGHAAGDEALVEMTASIRNSLADDDLFGRLGGDEFMMLLRNIADDDEALRRAHEICALSRRSFGDRVSVSASVGVVLCPRDGGDFDTLYKKVDVALYYVKNSGKDNCAIYRDEMMKQ